MRELLLAAARQPEGLGPAEVLPVPRVQDSSFEATAVKWPGLCVEAAVCDDPLKRMKLEARQRKALEEFVFGDWGGATL